MKRRLAPLIIVLLGWAGLAPAASAGTTLLKDIDPTSDTRNGSVSMDAWATAGGFAYFTQADDAHGTELWKTDGTSGGTQLVKDVTPGNRSSEIAVMVAAGTRIFFIANDGIHGRELWVSDGTEAGTRLVKDVQPGTGNGAPDSDLVAYGAGVAFAGNDGTSGSEPWVSDGTAAGTRLLKDVNTTPGTGSAPYSLFVDGTALYFAASDGTHGQEPWVSDGTTGGTRMVGDVNTGGSSSPGDFVAFNGTVLFTAVAGSERTIFGVTPSSFTPWTTAVSNPGVYGGGGTGGLVVLPGTTPRVLYTCDDATQGVEVCQVISPGNATVFADAEPGPDGSYPIQLTVVGTRAYFIATESTSGASRVWTATTVGDVTDVSGITYDSARNQAWLIRPLGNDILFSVPDADGYELWRATGATGTKVKDIRPGSGDSSPGGGGTGTQSIVLGSQVLFGADDGTSGYEVWKTDGTSGGTQLVRDIAAQVRGSNPNTFARFGSKAIFRASDQANGREPWITDGTPAGTRLLKDLNPGPADAGPYAFTEMGGTMYFVATTAAEGRELWKTDGTTAGTEIVKDINTGTGNGFSGSELVVFGDRLYFTADDGSGDGPELWTSDGTPTGTSQLLTIRPGSLGSFPSNFRQVGGRLYFAASDGTNGNELWSTDGTVGGTQLAVDVRSGSLGSSPAELTTLGSTLVFAASPVTGPRKLLTWDGTTLTTLGLSGGADVVGGLTVAGGRVYFVASDSTSGNELWSTDGTPGGTGLLRDIASGSFSSYPDAIAAVGPRVVFVANSDGATGRELWTSDGTTGGTQLLRDVFPGGDSSNPGFIGSAAGFAYYSADDGEHGMELWKTDGTAAGTSLASDVWAGPSDSYPSGPLVELGDRLVFGATLPGVGTEPVVLAPDEVVPFIPGMPAPEQLAFGLPKSGKLSAKKGTITLTVAAPAAGTLKIANGSTSKRKPKNYVRPSTTKASGKGTLTITLKPTATALKLLKKARKGKKPGSLKVTIKATFTAASGQVLTDTRTYTLKLK